MATSRGNATQLEGNDVGSKKKRSFADAANIPSSASGLTKASGKNFTLANKFSTGSGVQTLKFWPHEFVKPPSAAQMTHGRDLAFTANLLVEPVLIAST